MARHKSNSKHKKIHAGAVQISRSANNIRAAVFGINDGLVSNAGLIMGMVGAGVGSATLILAGVAGLLAGAFSMGAGEFISVRSQREMFERQIALEKKALAQYPQAEKQELAAIYTARGLPADEAEQVAEHLMTDPEHALQTLVKEALGIDPDDLVSPYGAAVSSFCSFVAGAAIPLLPFIFLPQASATPSAIALTATALFAVGASMSLFTGRNALFSGARMLLIGAAAGTITYLIGYALGV